MNSISLYINKGSWLNRLHPYTKLLYILTAMPLVLFSFTLILVIFLIQGLFNHDNRTVMFSIGVITFYREGVLFAVRIGCNILNMLLSFGIFVLTTSPQELVDELEKSGFSPKFGYIINSVFQILPQMMATKDVIAAAQRSRGMETEGNMLVRIKAFLPLISPVVMSSLINTRERAIALEVRGFGRKQKKTWLYDRPKCKWDPAVRGILVFLLVLVIVWRIW